MPQGWTVVNESKASEPTGWTRVEEPKQASLPQQSLVDSMLADNQAMPLPMRAMQGVLRMVKAHPVAAGATAGAALGSAATGGALAPVLAPWALGMAGAGLGAAGGAGAAIAGRQIASGTPESGKETAKTMATEGALGAAGEGAGRFVGKVVAPRLQSGAVSMYERMLKPNKTTVEGMPKFGRTLADRSRNIAQELIADPNGQISKQGSNAYANATNELGQKVDDLVAQHPEARGATSHLTDALDEGRGKFANQWAPSGDTSAYDRIAKEVTQNPAITKIKRKVVDTSTEHALGLAPNPTEISTKGREMIPRVRAESARDLTQGTYRSLGDKAYGELKGAETEAQKAAARGGRAILNEAIPQVEPLNNEISKRIDLGQVLDEGVFRSGKHDPVGLAQHVVASGSHPAGAFLSFLQRAGVGSPVARGAYRTGAALTGPNTAELMRAALIAALTGEKQ